MVEMPISAPSGCLQEDEVDCVYLERQKKKKNHSPLLVYSCERTVVIEGNPR